MATAKQSLEKCHPGACLKCSAAPVDVIRRIFARSLLAYVVCVMTSPRLGNGGDGDDGTGVFVISKDITTLRGEVNYLGVIVIDNAC